MDKQMTYQNAILTFLKDYAEVKPSDWKNVQNQVITDLENHHYQLVRVGWHNNEHIHYTVFHFDLVGDKVVIQENRTDLPILLASRLIDSLKQPETPEEKEKTGWKELYGSWADEEQSAEDLIELIRNSRYVNRENATNPQ